MKIPKVVAIDFETKGIEERPDYPPVPVGVSIQWYNQKVPKYFSWGHKTNNNCTKEEAALELKKIWATEFPVLFHHAKFDIDVAETHMGMVPLPWHRIHDTQFLLFLQDPHAESLALKASAERLLNMKPDERDALMEWILNNVPEAAKKKSTWGAYISEAPGTLAGIYANADVTRTKKLFEHLYPIIVSENMLAAYDRERKLLPMFLESERRGMRVDVSALRKDIAMYYGELEKAENWLLKKLKLKELNFDSDVELSKALENSKIVTDWELTKTGKRSTSKKTMTIEKFTDKNFFLVLGYRNRLTTCLRIFMEPWLAKAEKNKGYINPNWNQVRQPKGSDDTKGTRTGRPSCDNPNFLNVAKSFEDRGDDWTHPKFIDLAPLPLVRNYTLPDPNCVWLHRDYNQQELRILAHFENGKLMQAYKDDVRLDVHTFIQNAVKTLLGKFFDRSTIKTTVFGRIYGQGLGSLAMRLKVPVEEVKQVRDAQNKVLPGLPDIDKNIKDMARRGEPIVTWGGRIYYCEKPKYVEKFDREMTFEYKLLNYLVQGSAADATKEALIRWYYHPERKARFIVTVYDEINICAPKSIAKQQMKLLRECMESIELDVPLISDGAAGSSWGNLEKVKW